MKRKASEKNDESEDRPSVVYSSSPECTPNTTVSVEVSIVVTSASALEETAASGHQIIRVGEVGPRGMGRGLPRTPTRIEQQYVAPEAQVSVPCQNPGAQTRTTTSPPTYMVSHINDNRPWLSQIDSPWRIFPDQNSESMEEESIVYLVDIGAETEVPFESGNQEETGDYLWTQIMTDFGENLNAENDKELFNLYWMLFNESSDEDQREQKRKEDKKETENEEGTRNVIWLPRYESSNEQVQTGVMEESNEIPQPYTQAEENIDVNPDSDLGSSTHLHENPQQQGGRSCLAVSTRHYALPSDALEEIDNLFRQWPNESIEEHVQTGPLLDARVNAMLDVMSSVARAAPRSLSDRRTTS